MDMLSLLTLLLAPPVWAYVDPGAGHFLWQIATASLFGTAFVFRNLALRAMRFFRVLFSRS